MSVFSPGYELHTLIKLMAGLHCQAAQCTVLCFCCALILTCCMGKPCTVKWSDA